MGLRAAVFGAVFGFVMLLMPAAPIGARQSVVLKVTPSVAFAPANLIVRARIERDPANRAVEIVAESDSFYRSSEIQLDGDQAPRTNQFEFIGMPSGEYEVSATVFDASGGARAVAHQQVNVIASGGDGQQP